MRKNFLVSTLIIPITLLSACGGSSSESGEPINSRPMVYSASSYTNNETSDADLSGTWMYLEDSDVERLKIQSEVISYRTTGTTRSTISIVDNGDNTITLINCLQDVMNQQTISIGSGLISFDRGGYDIAGEVVNNRLIEARLFSTGDDTQVYSSVVTLVKIADELAFNNDGSLGSFDVTATNYYDDDYSGTLTDQPIHCFKQAHYKLVKTSDSAESSDTRSAIYFASFGYTQVPSSSLSGEDWLDSYFTELYVSDDATKDDANIQHWPDQYGSMMSYSQTGKLEINIVESTINSLSGSAKSTGYYEDDLYPQDIEIYFDIGL